MPVFKDDDVIPKIVKPPKPYIPKPITVAPKPINQFSPTSAYTLGFKGGSLDMRGSLAANASVQNYGGSLPGTFGKSNFSNLTPTTAYAQRMTPTGPQTSFNPLAPSTRQQMATSISPESGYVSTPYGTYYNPGGSALPSNYNVSPESGMIITKSGNVFYNPNSLGDWITAATRPPGGWDWSDVFNNSAPSNNSGGGGGGFGGGGYRDSFSMGLVNWRI